MKFLSLSLTALGSFCVLFLVTKFIGRKQIAQLDFFDYITGITIGSIASEMPTDIEAPWKPLAAMIIYGGATAFLSGISKKLTRSRKYLNGAPTILMDCGKLYYENLKKANKCKKKRQHKAYIFKAPFLYFHAFSSKQVYSKRRAIRFS